GALALQVFAGRNAGICAASDDAVMEMPIEKYRQRGDLLTKRARHEIGGWRHLTHVICQLAHHPRKRVLDSLHLVEFQRGPLRGDRSILERARIGRGSKSRVENEWRAAHETSPPAVWRRTA